MLFTFYSNFAKNAHETNELRTLAYKYVKKYNLKPSEYPLDKYLLQTYKIGLKQVCLILISRCLFQSDGSKKIIVTFNNQADHNLAALITYGNRSFLGSPILQKAFDRY